jgi:teichuronic acid exporter
MTVRDEAVSDALPGLPVAGAARGNILGDGLVAAAPLALDRALVHGVAWTATVKWVSQLLSWVTTIAIARLLMPSDYGIVGMAAVFIGFTSLVTEFGIGSSVLVYRDLERRHVAQLNSLAVMVGVGAFLLSLLVAAPLAAFYHTPPLRMVVVALGTGFVIDSLRTIPNALLVRDLRFKESALLEGTKQITGSVLGVIMAFAGWGYWALVVGNLAGSVVWSVAMLARHWRPYHRPRWSDLREVLGFSGRIIGERAAWFGYSNADFIIAGRLLGASALGLYTNAWTLANIPGDKILSLLQRVLPSIYSAVQRDVAALQRYFLLAHEALAFAIFPVTIGIVLVSQEFVPVVLGQKWMGMVAPLRVLALYVTLHTLSTLPPQLLVIRGHAKFMARVSLSGLVVLPISFYVGGKNWGTMGIAYAWLIVYPIIIAVTYQRALREIALSWRALFSSVWPAASGVIVMAIVVVSVRALLVRALDRPALLGVEVLVGAATYLICCMTVHRERLEALRDVVRKARRQGVASASSMVDAVEPVR